MGPAWVEASTAAIIAATSRRIRAGVAELREGRYHFEDVLDDDGMDAKGHPDRGHDHDQETGRASDLTGSGPQVRGNMNNSYAGLQAAVLYSLKALRRSRTGRPITALLDAIENKPAPKGSVVNAVFPARHCRPGLDLPANHRRHLLARYGLACRNRVIAASCDAPTGSAAFSGTPGADPGAITSTWRRSRAAAAGAKLHRMASSTACRCTSTNTSDLLMKRRLEREHPGHRSLRAYPRFRRRRHLAGQGWACAGSTAGSVIP